MNIRLTPEERDRILKLSGIKFHDGSSEAIIDAQIAKFYSWGNEPCPHANPYGDSEYPDLVIKKHECPECWESLA